MHSNCASVTILLIVLVLIIAFNLKLLSPSLDCSFSYIPLANLTFPTSCHLFSFLRMQLAVHVSDLSPNTLPSKKLCVRKAGFALMSESKLS